MRVVSGSAKGTKLISPEGDVARPTLDRVKEAIFSMLGSTLDMAVLDLFAGSGALGIEALSRGAASCIFVDNNKDSLAVTRNNLTKTHLLDRAECVLSGYENFILNNKKKFDLVFLDPPYKNGFLENALILLREHSLNDDAIILCEMEDSLPCEVPDGFSLIRDRKYGRCRVFLLKAS